MGASLQSLHTNIALACTCASQNQGQSDLALKERTLIGAFCRRFCGQQVVIAQRENRKSRRNRMRVGSCGAIDLRNRRSAQQSSSVS